MTVLHLAAKFGHVDVLEVLRGKVPWSMASVKVKMLICCRVFRDWSKSIRVGGPEHLEMWLIKNT